MTEIEIQQKTDAPPPSKGALLQATGIALAGCAAASVYHDASRRIRVRSSKDGCVAGADRNFANRRAVKGRTAATPAPGQTGVYTAQPKLYKVDSEDFS